MVSYEKFFFNTFHKKIKCARPISFSKENYQNLSEKAIADSTETEDLTVSRC